MISQINSGNSLKYNFMNTLFRKYYMYKIKLFYNLISLKVLSSLGYLIACKIPKATIAVTAVVLMFLSCPLLIL